jgi:hypothetical protein
MYFPQEILEKALHWLESENYHLWYDADSKLWAIINDSEKIEYALTGEDKNRLIIQAYHDLVK